MGLYGDLLRDALSTESSLKSAVQEGFAEQGTVMIELPTENDDIDAEVLKISTSLESKGWKVKTCVGTYSPEDSSEGVHAGLPSMNTDNGVNNVVNGVYVPELKSSDVYQVVQLIRPEDTVQAGTSKILYLMNGDGDIKDMLRDEGHLVVDERDAIHLLLSGQTTG